MVNFAISQPVVTNASNHRIMGWDSGYRIETKRFFDIYYQYTVKKQDKLTAEYLRYDNSCYFFVSYDSAGKPNQHGFIKLNTHPFECDTLAVVNRKADPTGSKGITKDTLICHKSYRKEGYWKGTDSSGMIWKGMYKNGAREGKWEEGIYFILHHEASISEVLYNNFKPYRMHLFNKGIEKSFYRDLIFWPEIKGKWFFNATIDSNTYVLKRSGIGKIYLNFETSKLYSSIRRSDQPVMHLLEKYNAYWKQTGDLIEIIENNETKILQVMNLNRNELILKFIKWRN